MNGSVWIELENDTSETRLTIDGVVAGTRDDISGWLRVLAERILDGEPIEPDTYNVQ